MGARCGVVPTLMGASGFLGGMPIAASRPRPQQRSRDGFRGGALGKHGFPGSGGFGMPSFGKTVILKSQPWHPLSGPGPIAPPSRAPAPTRLPRTHSSEPASMARTAEHEETPRAPDLEVRCQRGRCNSELRSSNPSMSASPARRAPSSGPARESTARRTTWSSPSMPQAPSCPCESTSRASST